MKNFTAFDESERIEWQAHCLPPAELVTTMPKARFPPAKQN